jgi:hypothetical protein
MFRQGALFAILASLATVQSARAEEVGFLNIERKNAKGAIEQEIRAYEPLEGDLIFYDDHHVVWSALFAYAGTGSPLHMGIVFKKSNGKLAVLEAGPDDSIWVKLLDIDKRLPQFQEDFMGLIRIRRCKKVLAEEESKALTKFAVAQDGKRYAVGRLMLQGTRFRERGLKDDVAKGKTILDRDSWICSELSVAAGTVAKLFDPKVVHSTVAYPRDLVDNARYDLGEIWHDAAVWWPTRPKVSVSTGQ